MIGTARQAAGPGSRPQGGRSACAWGATPDEFHRLVAPWLDALSAKARRIVHCDHAAQDAIQEALMSLWGEPVCPQNVRAWLIRAVTHRALHQMRSAARRRKHERFACALCRESDRRGDAAARAEADEQARRLHAALDRLPEAHREVLQLRALDELDYESIAARLCIPTGTVRSRLNRARTALERLLDRSA